MIIVDRALHDRETAGRPISVGVLGAGFMARGFVSHVTNSVPGMRVAAICARRTAQAHDVARLAGLAGFEAHEPADVDAADGGTVCVTDDPLAITRSETIDCLVDMTGSVAYGAMAALDAFAHGKHVVLMNAELDATLGPYLRKRAEEAGVLVTASDGDQPGVQLNLWRFVRGLGLIPRVLGNVKGLQDPYRTPTTQADFAARWGQNPTMVTSFADGSKVNFEQAIVANATGFGVHRRGMLGMDHRGHVDQLVDRYDIDVLRTMGGAVDYVVGATPGPGVYCLAEHPDPAQQHYLELFKLGRGPLYSFYQPYHLCHFEAPTTVARVVLFSDVVGRCSDVPAVEVVAIAKRDLKVGEILDSYGEFTSYGEIENATVVRRARLLPEGLTEGCRLVRDVPKDAPIRWDDVVPPESLAHDLYRHQWEEIEDRSVPTT